ncbi:hypothetical protein Bcsk_012400 [Bartonella sp. CDC_skunk]|uniref:Uncharacterized protein n=1 Tax=Bartonella rochalimae ATCC BAA-1498 TaxID=685782 RepID=E6YN63_9HYPH|nr:MULTISPECIES: hypothetical protein [Bartonella]AQX18845.1 hypothetical protein BA1379B_010410 [Bartonella sp. A1379B]AQX21850.1 hypothetical protein Bcsk_012400 [Bartonella sp. CDC_skunk]AQX22068.1 hypothetical protein Bho11B_000340 [Bartonella sp. 11B]AQX24654.1 hypothetical protein Bho114_013470 [Bartonella sp. 114]AQX25836.1 hypothetical protein Bco22_011890 [Bartonella sp. Coyote22sub2]
MIFLFRWGFAILLVIVIALSSFFYGRSFERTRSLIQAISALQNREKINAETFTLSPFSLCRALGGMPKECAVLLHRMEKASNH